MSLQMRQIRSDVPQFAFHMHVLSCNTHQNSSGMPELLLDIHHSQENPVLRIKKKGVSRITLASMHPQQYFTAVLG